MAKFLLTERGGRKLIHNGYSYVKKREDSKQITWQCEWRQRLKCNGYAKTVADVVDGGEVEEFGMHLHVADLSKSEVVAAKNLLKRKATNPESMVKTSNIVCDVVGQLSTPAVAKGLPYIESMKRVVRRYRSAHLAPTPTTVSSLIIPEEYKKSLDGEDFLVLDDTFGGEGGNSRIVVFSTKKNMEILKECTVWLADGTFSIAPTIFRQLYTVHGLIGGETIPLVYALTTDQKEETYSRIFGLLHKKIVDGGDAAPPNFFITDFETAAMNSIRKLFDGATTIHGCFFHLCQSIYRQVVDAGHKELYAKDAQFVQYIKMIQALSFVPVHCVPNYYLQLENSFSSATNDKAKAALGVLHYFGRTYVRIGAKFPPSLWNNVELTRMEGPRTNNTVEAWHRRFQSNISCDHPSMWKLLRAIQEEQRYNERYYAIITAGKGKRRKAKYDMADEHLQQAINLFSITPFDDYLKGIAANF